MKFGSKLKFTVKSFVPEINLFEMDDKILKSQMSVFSRALG